MNDKNKKNIIIPTFLSKELVDQIFVEKILALEERKYLKTELIKEDNGDGGDSSIPSFDYFLKKVISKASKQQEKTDGSEIIKDIEGSLEKVKDKFKGTKGLTRDIDKKIDERVVSIYKNAGCKNDSNFNEILSFIMHSERLICFLRTNLRDGNDKFGGGIAALTHSDSLNKGDTFANFINSNNSEDNRFLFSFLYYLNYLSDKSHRIFKKENGGVVGRVGFMDHFKGLYNSEDVEALEDMFFNDDYSKKFKEKLKLFTRKSPRIPEKYSDSKFENMGIEKEKTPFSSTYLTNQERIDLELNIEDLTVLSI